METLPENVPADEARPRLLAHPLACIFAPARQHFGL